MKSNNYMAVIEALGEMIMNKDFVIANYEDEIKALKHKIESIEQHIDFYLENEVTESDYKSVIERR